MIFTNVYLHVNDCCFFACSIHSTVENIINAFLVAFKLFDLIHLFVCCVLLLNFFFSFHSFFLSRFKTVTSGAFFSKPSRFLCAAYDVRWVDHSHIHLLFYLGDFSFFFYSPIG